MGLGPEGPRCGSVHVGTHEVCVSDQRQAMNGARQVIWGPPHRAEWWAEPELRWSSICSLHPSSMRARGARHCATTAKSARFSTVTFFLIAE